MRRREVLKTIKSVSQWVEMGVITSKLKMISKTKAKSSALSFVHQDSVFRNSSTPSGFNARSSKNENICSKYSSSFSVEGVLQICKNISPHQQGNRTDIKVDLLAPEFKKVVRNSSSLWSLLCSVNMSHHNFHFSGQ